MFDADGNKLRTGDLVRVLYNAGSLAEGESKALRRVLGYAANVDLDMVVLEWEGGSQVWPADACRKVAPL